MSEKEIVIAKLRARGVSEKAIKEIVKRYRSLAPAELFKGV